MRVSWSLNDDRAQRVSSWARTILSASLSVVFLGGVRGSAAMVRVEVVHRLNIEHLHEMLVEEPDDARRRHIRRLLARERANLAALADRAQLEKQM